MATKEPHIVLSSRNSETIKIFVTEEQATKIIATGINEWRIVSASKQ